MNQTKVPLLISTETFSTLTPSYHMEDTLIQSTKTVSMPNHTYDTNKETMKTSIYISGQSTEEETLSSTVAGTKRIQKKKFQAGLKHLYGSLNIVVVLLWWFSEFQETFLLLLFWQDHRCMFCLEHSFCWS